LGALPTYVTNSQNKLPTISFVGSKCFTFTVNGSTFPTGNSPFSVFIIGKNGTSGSTQAFLGWGGDGLGQPLFGASNNGSTLLYTLLGGSQSTTATVLDTFMLFGSVNTTSSTNPYRNGTIFTTLGHNNYSIPQTYAGFIGATALNQRPLNGNIGEIIVYSSELTTLEREKVEGYLAWKWGIQADLPITHPYYNFRP